MISGRANPRHILLEIGSPIEYDGNFASPVKIVSGMRFRIAGSQA